MAIKLEELLARISEKNEQKVELIIGFRPGKKEDLVKKLERIGKVRRVFSNIPFLAFDCDAATAQEIAYQFYSNQKSMNLDGAVEYMKSVEINSKVHTVPIERGANYYLKTPLQRNSLWNLDEINAYDAQNLSSGKGAVIAIVDTGIDYRHSLLKGKFRKGYNFVTETDDAMDDNGHGTHVAGIAGGDVFGVSTKADLIAAKCLDADGSGSEIGVISGVDWAVTNNADIINMSLGAPSASTAFKEICEAAYSRGVIITAAAGNDGTNTKNYPAAFPCVVSVTALERGGKHADYSNINDQNDLAAPGTGIASTYPGNASKVLSGTSMASPHAAGTFALAVSYLKKNPELLEEALKKTASKLDNELPYDSGWVFGAGEINALSFVEKIVNNKKLARRFYLRS